MTDAQQTVAAMKLLRDFEATMIRMRKLDAEILLKKMQGFGWNKLAVERKEQRELKLKFDTLKDELSKFNKNAG